MLDTIEPGPLNERSGDASRAQWRQFEVWGYGSRNMKMLEREPATFLGSFIRAVFDFDTHRSAVTGVGQRRKELPPIDSSHTGKLWRVPQIRVRKDADIIKQMLVDVLGAVQSTTIYLIDP